MGFSKQQLSAFVGEKSGLVHSGWGGVRRAGRRGPAGGGDAEEGERGDGAMDSML